MKETRIGRFSEKVITEENLNQINKFILKIFNIENKEYKRITYNININYTDESTIVIENAISDIFDCDLLIKEIDVINFQYWNFDNNNQINLTLKSDNKFGEYKVIGSDNNWVKANYLSLSELVQSFEPQNQILRKYHFPIAIIPSWFFGVAFSKVTTPIVGLFLSKFITTDQIAYLSQYRNYLYNNNSETVFAKIFLTICYIGIGYWFVQRILIYIEKIWPSIEFQLGPYHIQKSRNQRKIIINVFIIFLIPLLINLLSYYLTK